MKKTRYTEEQIIGVLKQMEAGRKVAELARELGVSEATLYTWKSKYGGMEVNEARRLRELEEENRRLKQLVADLSLDREALKDGDPKKRLELVGQRQDVAFVMAEHGVSERRACKLLGMDRSSYRYEPKPDEDAATAGGVDRSGAAEAAVRIPAAGRTTGAARAQGESQAPLPPLSGGAPGGAAAEAKAMWCGRQHRWRI